MVILQFSADVSPCSDGTSAFTPSGTVGHQVPESVMAESHGLDAGSSDASLSSHEHTDASSVDSLDTSSAEKRKSKSVRLVSLKDTVVAMMCQKRKSVTTPTTHADDSAPSGRSPEAYRRSSAPQERPSTNRLCLPVPSGLSNCPPCLLYTSPSPRD